MSNANFGNLTKVTPFCDAHERDHALCYNSGDFMGPLYVENNREMTLIYVATPHLLFILVALCSFIEKGGPLPQTVGWTAGDFSDATNNNLVFNHFNNAPRNATYRGRILLGEFFCAFHGIVFSPGGLSQRQGNLLLVMPNTENCPPGYGYRLFEELCCYAQLLKDIHMPGYSADQGEKTGKNMTIVYLNDGHRVARTI